MRGILIAALLALSFAGIKSAAGETPRTNPEAARSAYIPDRLKLIFGQGERQDYLTRVKAVHALTRHLNRDEIDAVYAFLIQPPTENDLKPLELNAVKNELVIALMRQQVFPSELTGKLIAMYYDKTIDPTWRDYCIQFIGQLYLQDKTEESEQQAVRNALWDALDERGNGIAGTAILTLWRTAGHEGFPKDKIAQAAFALATDPKVEEIVKVPALQVGANLKYQPMLEVAYDALKNSRTVQLKMSALATVGILGSAGDLELLKQWQDNTDVRLRAAARGAIKAINKRSALRQ